MKSCQQLLKCGRSFRVLQGALPWPLSVPLKNLGHTIFTGHYSCFTPTFFSFHSCLDCVDCLCVNRSLVTNLGSKYMGNKFLVRKLSVNGRLGGQDEESEKWLRLKLVIGIWRGLNLSSLGSCGGCGRTSDSYQQRISSVVENDRLLKLCPYFWVFRCLLINLDVKFIPFVRLQCNIRTRSLCINW
jgi:hypothetical protein